MTKTPVTGRRGRENLKEGVFNLATFGELFIKGMESPVALPLESGCRDEIERKLEPHYNALRPSSIASVLGLKQASTMVSSHIVLSVGYQTHLHPNHRTSHFCFL